MLNLLRALFVVLLTHATLFGQLAVDIKEMNADAVPRYEKLELTLQLDQVSYSNPFNPNEIDVTAFLLHRATAFGQYLLFTTTIGWPMPGKCVLLPMKSDYGM